MENRDEIVEKEKMQQVLNASLTVCLDLDNAFKMYSYRIISHEQFAERVSECIKVYDDLITE